MFYRRHLPRTVAYLSRETRDQGTDTYAVWLFPAVRNPAFVLMQPNVPILVGVIKPPVGSRGMLAAKSVLPHARGLRDFELLITLEPSTSTKTLGRYVLEGSIAF